MDSRRAGANVEVTTYAYEIGAIEITHLHWSQAAQKLTHTGAQLTGPSDASLVKIVHARLACDGISEILSGIVIMRSPRFSNSNTVWGLHNP
jgi:hypothetical protein